MQNDWLQNKQLFYSLLGGELFRGKADFKWINECVTSYTNGHTTKKEQISTRCAEQRVHWHTHSIYHVIWSAGVSVRRDARQFQSPKMSQAWLRATRWPRHILNSTAATWLQFRSKVTLGKLSKPIGLPDSSRIVRAFGLFLTTIKRRVIKKRCAIPEETQTPIARRFPVNARSAIFFFSLRFNRRNRNWITNLLFSFSRGSWKTREKYTESYLLDKHREERGAELFNFSFGKYFVLLYARVA